MNTNLDLVKQTIINTLQKEDLALNELLQSCHSIFPDGLLTALHEMKTQGQIEQYANNYSLTSLNKFHWKDIQNNWDNNAKDATSALSQLMDQIHLPHCLDYEWWFSHGSREALAKKLLLENPLPRPNVIAFLGSPLLGAFASHCAPEIKFIILDKSEPSLHTVSKFTGKNVQLVHYNVEKPLPIELIGVAEQAFFDPPWYVEYYDIFFRRCIQLTHGRRATISSVLFPILTRPNSLEERKQVFEIAIGYGLNLVELETRVAHYLTPHFESQALGAKGISTGNWRKGDLATFISNGTTLPENTTEYIEKVTWREVLVGKIKVKIKIKPEENENEYIAPMILTVKWIPPSRQSRIEFKMVS